MNSFKRLLGYHKRVFKEAIFQWVFINRIRQKISIGKKCTISYDLKYGENIQIRDYVYIGENVRICDGVIIGRYASIHNISIKENSYIEGGVKITGNGQGVIEIGRESYIGINNTLDFSDNITIGDFVHIAGPSTGLWTHTSAKQAFEGIYLKNKNTQFRPTAPINIESNVYIGGNCTIYPGVKIGHHSIIAPNSAVNKDVLPYSFMGGVPAKLIKRLSG